MTVPSPADRLRAVAESLEPALGLKANDPDLLDIKRILLAKVAVLEARAINDANRRSAHV